MAGKAASRAADKAGPRTLTIDIGGTGIKMMTLDAQARPLNERARELTPQPATPDAVLAVCARMLAAQPAFDRVAVGFPGVVQHGVVRTAPNLGTEAWRGFDLRAAIQKLAHKPTRAINDADLQGYGVIRGEGVELVLTLGTGLGSGLYTAGRLVDNLELGHHPFRKGRTYEQSVGDAARKRVGKRRWQKRVRRMIDTLEPIFNYDVLYLGGGNAEDLDDDLPANVKVYTPAQGLAGGVRLWDMDPER